MAITEVLVPGAVIRANTDAGFTEAEAQAIRNQFRTPEDVQAALAMGDAMRKTFEAWRSELDRIAEQYA